MTDKPSRSKKSSSKLNQELIQREAELAVINSVQEGLASKLDIQAIYELIGEKVREVFNVQVADIVTYDQTTNLISMPYSYEKGDRSVIAPREPYGFRLDVINSRAPLLINQNFAELASQHYNPLLTGEWPKSAMFVPLLVDDKVKGIISIQDIDRENAYSTSDVRLLQTLANAMSVALENARLFAETQRLLKETEDRAAELAIINSVQAALAAQLDIHGIFEAVGDKLQEIFSYQDVTIYFGIPKTDTVMVEYSFVKGEKGERRSAPMNSVYEYIIESNRTFVFNGDIPAFLAKFSDYSNLEPPKSLLAVPVRRNKDTDPIVYLTLQDWEGKKFFSDSDVRLMETLANSMSVALENARLFDETQQRNAELAIINSVQEGLASKLEMQEIYELVGEKLRGIFQHADLSIGVYDPETDLLSAPFGVEHGRRISFPSLKLNGRGIIGHMLHDPKSLLFNEDMEHAIVEYQSADVTEGGIPKSALYVPLMMGGFMHGVVVLEDMQKEHAFRESDVHLLETLANSMSVALENARLWEQEKLYRKALEREFEIGREIQAGFLPDSLPQPKGWEIAASLKSAREVAGDFYDVFELPDDKIGLVIADVCDKGLGAALFMTLFRSLIRAVSNVDFFARTQADGLDSSALRLKNAISLTNNYIAETHGDTGMFATIFFGILDPRTGVLTYINGGHLPPMLVNAQGVKEILKFSGPAVGALADANYVIREAMIEQGESFFAYTDGLTDTENPAGESFSEKKLIPLLIKNQPLSPLLAEIQKRVADHAAGAKQFDDITMLAVRRGGK
jgi:serine phosphatase RsbU (regulator of sigma subunit)